MFGVNFAQSLVNRFWNNIYRNKIRRKIQNDVLPKLQPLECRTMLTVRVWDGGAALNDRWSDPKNWVGDVAPVFGQDDLVFPAGVGLLDRSTRNDFGSFVVKSIRIEGSDYKITGGRIQLNSTATIESVATTGTNTIESEIAFNQGVRKVNSNNRLVLSGVLSSGNLTFPVDAGQLQITTSAGGEVVFSGTSSNTYHHPVKVLRGLLTLNKTNGARAIVSPLQIGEAGSTTSAQVRKVSTSTAGQLHPTAPIGVTIFGGTTPSILDTGSTNESISSLTIAGAVLRGTANLTIKGTVSTGNSSLDNLIDTRNLNLNAASGGSTQFQVTGSPLKIQSQIGNALIRKDGTRQLTIAPKYASNTFTGGITILEGEVRLESPSGFAAVSSGEITVRDDLTVLNDAAVADSVIVTVGVGGSAFLGGETGERLQHLLIPGGFVQLGVPLVVDQFLQIRQAGVLRTGNSSLTVKGLTQIDFAGASTPTLFATSSVRLDGGVEMEAGLIDASQPSSQLTIFGKLKSKSSSRPSRITGRVAFANPLGINIALDTADGAAPEDLIIDAAITGAQLPINKVGLGTAVFNGANTFTQTVRANAGTLLVNGQHVNGQYEVNGGTLGGNGRVNSIKANSGIVAPGSSPGKLRSSTTQFLGTSRFLVEINGITPVTQFDQLESGAQLGFANGPFPTLDVRLGFTPAIGADFPIIVGLPDTGVNGTRFQDTTGNVLDQNEVFLVNGQAFQIDYQANGGDAVSLKRVNNPPAFQNRQITSAVEGGLATLTGLITETDPLDDFFLEVNWGDGTPLETFTFPAGSPRKVSVTHRYVQDGNYRVNLLWKDNHDAFNTANLSVVIRNAPPSIQVLGYSSNVQARQPFTLTGIIRDAGLNDSHRLTVNWGDGTPTQVLTIDPSNRTFLLQHIYATRGVKRIRLTATDESGRSVTTFVRVRILRPT